MIMQQPARQFIPRQSLHRTVRAVARSGLMAGLFCATVSGAAMAEDSTVHDWCSSGNVTVADRFPEVQPSGIARLPDGRIVLSLPTSAQSHKGPVLVTWEPGKLTPFPDKSAQSQMMSPLGMTVDANGQLWVLDEGMRPGSTAPAKPALLRIDPKTNKIVRRYAFDEPVVRADSHVNDVRIDLTHGRAGTAFITDTSQTTHPALLVVDLASGAARRILEETVSVSSRAGICDGSGWTAGPV